MAKGGDADAPVPRLRDLPAPRKNPSLAGPLFQALWAWPYRIALAGLLRLGVRAWHLTVLSLAGNVIVGWLLTADRHFLAGILLLPAGLFDIFDGAVARLRGEASRKGALFDAVNDRVSDAVVFGSLLFSLVTQERLLAAALALSALTVSLFVSHVRAEGEAAGLDMSGGMFQRLERYLVLMLGLTLPGALIPVLAILTGLGAVTMVQRGARAWRGSAPGSGRSS